MNKILLSIFLTAYCFLLMGQQAGITEQELIKKAESFYNQKIWQEALPLYAQLVSVHPKNAIYNKRFGICGLMGDRTNSTRSIRYLTRAHQTLPKDKELLYYLGLAYYQNQEFASALQYFFDCLEYTSSSDPIVKEINEHINACQRGMDLLHKNHLDEIISKKEYQYENFHRAYPPDELDGSLIQKPSNFITPNEMKSGERSYVYVTEPRGTVYYSGYPDDNTIQRDLFKVSINDNGEWGEPKALTDEVNTSYDEAFPVVTNNGTVLYFSSKGHNSMGGYDVFKSVLNEKTGKFSIPENMGVGINSPYDDILFIPDRSGKKAFFSSNRESIHNNISVFKIGFNTEVFALQEPHLENNNPDIPPTEVVSTESQESKSDQALALNNEPQVKTISVEEMESISNKQTKTKEVDENISGESNGLRVKWELVYEDEVEEKPEPVDPVKQVQNVKYAASQSSWIDEDESLDIVLETEPFNQVQTIKYVWAENTMPEPENNLKIMLEEEPVKQVQKIRYAEAQSTLLNEEESLEIFIEPTIAQQVQSVEYVTSDSPIFTDEEILEIQTESVSLQLVEAITLAFDQMFYPDEEDMEIHFEAAPLQSEIQKQEAGIRETANDISSLMASDDVLISYPDTPMMPLQVESKGTQNQIIKKALSRPDALSYEELLYAASLTDNPEIRLDIYYNAFIRLDRDWRVYYNASVAAQKSSNPGQAELYLYQARLISDKEVADEIRKEFRPNGMR